MAQQPGGTRIVDAQLHTSLATLQVMRFHWTEPTEGILAEQDDHLLDLCLTPRPRDARARYCDRWPPTRYEQIGGLFLVPAGHTIHARSAGGEQISVICRLHSEAIRHWFESEIDWTDRRLESALDIASPTIRALLLRLAEEARHPGLASAALAELIAAQLSIEVARACGTMADGPATGGLAPWRLRAIDQRLAEPGAAPTLAELSGLCGMSIRQLTRGFRVSRGMSIGTHIERARIAEAQGLLARRQGIKEVAYHMGFASPSSFSYAFRRATGETPRQFRERAGRTAS